MEKVELMPCPLCGAEMGIEGEGWEHPASDDCPLDSLFILPNHVEAWNRRAPVSADAVPIKPLVWQNVDEICTRMTAPALGGDMMIVELDPGSGVYSAGFDVGGLAFCFVKEIDPLGNGRQTRPAQYNSIDEAKAAAQADYETRIREALE